MATIAACYQIPIAAFSPSATTTTTHRHLPSPLPIMKRKAGSMVRRRNNKQSVAGTVKNNPSNPSSTSTTQLEASPSGIDEWPVIAQVGVFAGVYVGLAFGTLVGTKILDGFSKSVIGLEQWRNNVIDTALPLVLGILYLTAGVGHFLSADAFRDIYPPPGTWGFWYLPGSASFHVTWTGVVEALGGLGLLFAGGSNLAFGGTDNELELPFSLVQPVSALILFLLTVVVTPANIYMFTHGAVMGDMAPLDMNFHAIRFVVQVVFLSLLLTLAKDSFFFAWGDELD